MKLRLQWAWLLSAFALITTSAPAPAAPAVLRHSLFAPGTNAQSGAWQGYSVAVDGNLAVVGAPSDDVGGKDCGVVKVYSTLTGALLHTLTNPVPAEEAIFGEAVAVSGSKVVVGAPWDSTAGERAGVAYVYDLAGATPTRPLLTLTNPVPEWAEYFGFSVAIQGKWVVVGELYDSGYSDSAGSVHVYDLSGATPAIPFLMLHNPSPGYEEQFGFAVAVSGDRVVVGEPKDNATGFYGGSAHVYDLASATPEVPILNLSDNSEHSFFGMTVAISGTRVVVGAWKDDEEDDYGIVHVFQLSGAEPAVPFAKLINPAWSSFESGRFGSAISISGTRVVVGAPRLNTGATNAGLAYLFDMASATPDRSVLTFTNPTPAAKDYFGSAVAISGLRMLIGAFGDSTLATNAGSAYLYNLGAVTPAAPVATLNRPSPSAARFGVGVAVSGTRLLVGATGDRSAPDVGRAYVYDLAGPAPRVPWLTLTNPGPAVGHSFGSPVALSGTRAVVGAPWEMALQLGAPSVYVYELSSATPALPVLTLKNPSEAGSNGFGLSLALSGTRLVVGARSELTSDIAAGAAYVYDLAGATPWLPMHTLRNPNPAAGDYFGDHVAISGTKLIIGAFGDDTGATDAGIAYVYDLGNPMPTRPALTLTNPSPAQYAWFGYSVALSGSLAVVGSLEGVSGQSTSGHAYVYDLAGATPTTPIVTLTNPSTQSSHFFGGAMAVSGSRIVVGATYDAREAAAIGHAWVYDMAGATPEVPVAPLPNPNVPFRHPSGWTLAIDGLTVVAGAPGDTAPAAGSGAAYVFTVGPTLRFAPAGPGLGTLSWTPTNSPGFVLQLGDSLGSTNWHNAPSGTANPVTVSTTNASRYYRLAQP